MSPLLRAAQEKVITWTQECQYAFDTIRELLMKEPILKLPKFDLDFEVHTDACDYGVGGVLVQHHDKEEHPVAYFSKHLSKQEPDEDENVVEDEPIMINYIIATNNPLNHEQQADQNLEWIYNLKIQAITENKDRILVTDFENQEQRSLYKQWHRIQIISDRLYRAWTFEKRNKQCVVFQYIVPRNQRLEIIQLSHDSPISGHLGTERTTMRIAERFFWPGWESEVKNYVISCQQCQQSKASRQSTTAPLQPILSSRPIEILTADIMGPIQPKSISGFEYVLVVCDHFTKYA